jgi:uncharacterized lipoprotein YajG
MAVKILKYLVFIALVLLLSGCSTLSQAFEGSPYPATEIVPEEPVMVGYVVKVIEDKGALIVMEGITKEEAMDIDVSNTLGVLTFYSNVTEFEGAFEAGNKVAIWESKESAENTVEIAERIVLLEK